MDAAQSIKDRHHKAKQELFLMLNTLRNEESISHNTYICLVQRVEQIEDDPFSLLQFFNEDKGEMEVAINGKKFKAILSLTNLM